MPSTAPTLSVSELRHHFDLAERELRILKHEEARIESCIATLRESAVKQSIRDALNDLKHSIRIANGSVTRRRIELESAEGGAL